jgi:DNA-binding HxlR family transcriptional regulator
MGGLHTQYLKNTINHMAPKEMRCRAECPAQRTLLIIGGRWKIPILYHLASAPVRFSELRRLLLPITPKMLSQQLRELERDGIVRRKIYPQIPPKVEYSLTATGKSLGPIVLAMCKWGQSKR